MQLKDMAGMLKQVQQMSQKMEDVQKELEKITVSGEAGGGMVKVIANGKQRILKIEIEKDLLKPEEYDMTQDLIVAAVNKALDEATKVAQDEMAKVTGGIMPGGGMDFLKDLNLGS
jgi:nucleoid-associated protein EbfC